MNREEEELARAIRLSLGMEEEVEEEEDAALARALEEEERTAMKEEKERRGYERALAAGLKASQEEEGRRRRADRRKDAVVDRCLAFLTPSSSSSPPHSLDLSHLPLDHHSAQSLLLLLHSYHSSSLTHLLLPFLSISDPLLAQVIAAIPPSHLLHLSIAAFLPSFEAPLTAIAIQTLLSNAPHLQSCELFLEPLLRPSWSLVPALPTTLTKLHLALSFQSISVAPLASLLMTSSVSDLSLMFASSPGFDPSVAQDSAEDVATLVLACSTRLESLCLCVAITLGCGSLDSLTQSLVRSTKMRRFSLLGLWGGDKKLMPSMVRQALQAWPLLEELVLSTRRRHLKPFVGLAGPLTNLTKVSITYIKVIKPGELDALFSCLTPALTELCLTSSRIGNLGAFSPQALERLRSFTKLEKLLLKTGSVHSSLLLMLDCFPCLSTLGVAVDETLEVPDGWKFPPNVKSLEVSLLAFSFSMTRLVDVFGQLESIDLQILEDLNADVAALLGHALRRVPDVSLSFSFRDDPSELLQALLEFDNPEPCRVRRLALEQAPTESSILFNAVHWNCNLSFVVDNVAKDLGLGRVSWLSPFLVSWLKLCSHSWSDLPAVDSDSDSQEMESSNLWLPCLRPLADHMALDEDMAEHFREFLTRQERIFLERKQTLLELGRALLQYVPVRDVRRIILIEAGRLLLRD